MILDTEQFRSIDNLYRSSKGVTYLAINSGARTTTETIERYLGDGMLLTALADDTPAWVAVVDTGWAQWCVDRLASGLHTASPHTSYRDAEEAAAERYFATSR